MSSRNLHLSMGKWDFSLDGSNRSSLNPGQYPFPSCLPCCVQQPPNRQRFNPLSLRVSSQGQQQRVKRDSKQAARSGWRLSVSLHSRAGDDNVQRTHAPTSSLQEIMCHPVDFLLLSLSCSWQWGCLLESTMQKGDCSPGSCYPLHSCYVTDQVGLRKMPQDQTGVESSYFSKMSVFISWPRLMKPPQQSQEGLQPVPSLWISFLSY